MGDLVARFRDRRFDSPVSSGIIAGADLSGVCFTGKKFHMFATDRLYGHKYVTVNRFDVVINRVTDLSTLSPLAMERLAVLALVKEGTHVPRFGVRLPFGVYILKGVKK